MQNKLLKVLLYFDVFSYPLSCDELFAFSGLLTDRQKEAAGILNKLVDDGHVNHYEGFYFMNGDKTLIQRRLEGNMRARQRLRDAQRYSRIIATFPFVRGVFLSGSISKEFMAERDDIDYFIVTEPGRLWICRSLLVLFKKLFLFNSYRNFCINYFVDAHHLAIKEQNQFVATEIATTIPTYNLELHRSFLSANEWTRHYYPGFRRNGDMIVADVSLVKRFSEWLFGLVPAGKLDRYLLKRSHAYIRKKFNHMDKEAFSQAFSIRRHELRFLPERQQNRILKRFNDNLLDFKKRSGICLLDQVEIENSTK